MTEAELEHKRERMRTYKARWRHKHPDKAALRREKDALLLLQKKGYVLVQVPETETEQSIAGG